MTSNPDDSLLLPFFNDKATSAAIRSQQSVPEQDSWASYYRKWGCLRCGDREGPHVACGCCQTCYLLIVGRKRQIIREEERMREEGRGSSEVLPQAIYPSEKRELPKGRQRKPRPPSKLRVYRAINVHQIHWQASVRIGKPYTKWLGNVKSTTKARAQRKADMWLRKLKSRLESLPANTPQALPTGSPEPPAGGALAVVPRPQAETHEAHSPTMVEPTPAARPPRRRQIARSKKPRVKPTVRLVNQTGGRYWRIIFRSNGRPQTKWFASGKALNEEQAQELADAWLKEHHPEFFASVNPADL